MIYKIIELKGLGPLNDAIADGPVDFGQCTVIYGDNGRGKSMLSHLLRSLASDDCSMLRPRKTIGSQAGPVASLRVGKALYTLKDYGWDPKPSIPMEVFDGAFVSANIYSGDAVSIDHRRSLCRFILGEKGVKLARHVEELDEKIGDLRKQVKTAEAGIAASIDDAMPLEEYLVLSDQPDIDVRIEDACRRLEAAENAGAIASRAHFEKVEIPLPPDTALLKVLAESVETVAQEAAGMVADHIASHLGADGEKWLEAGMRYAHDVCPFCGQDLSDAGLVTAMRAYFSQAYVDLRDRVEESRRAALQALDDSQLRTAQSAMGRNDTLAEFWRSFIDFDDLEAPAERMQAAWDAVRQELAQAYDSKLGNPLGVMDPAALSSQLEELCADAVAELRVYNSRVDQLSAAIAEKKRAAAAVDEARCREELKKLKLHKTGLQPERREECQRLIDLRTAGNTLEKKKTEAKEELAQYLADFTEEYQCRLNEFLANCGTAFRITKLEAGFPAGTPASDYCICLRDYETNASAKLSEKPHFGSMMSEGDRRTLAFAFFIARLQRDPGLADKIVVLDDPTCSLGMHRGFVTTEAIADIAGKCKQLIVLTHDANFALATFRSLQKTREQRGGAPVTSLQLRLQEDWSVLEPEPSDFRDLCANELADNIRTVERFVAGDKGIGVRSAEKCFRPMIEVLLRLKYPTELGRQTDLGKMAAAIKASGAGSTLAHLQPHVTELYAVSTYGGDTMHGDTGTSVAAEREHQARAFARRVLELRTKL